MARWLKIHVIATSIIGAQLVVWAATGFAFTLFDFSVVHGDADRAKGAKLEVDSAHIPLADVVLRARAARPGAPHEVKTVLLAMVDGRAMYSVAFTDEATDVLVDASDGALCTLDAGMAARIATHAFQGPVGAARVDSRDEGGRRAFVVTLDDAGATEVTVDGRTGEITSWHNRTWRLFDTLWSLHVLGYLNRSSPAHWPLRVVGLLATLAVGSGAGLLILRLFRRVRRRTRIPLR